MSNGKKGNIKNKVWLIVFLILNAAVLYYLISQDNQLNTQSIEYIKAFNPVFILLAVFCVLVYLALDVFLYYYLVKIFTGKHCLAASLRVSLLGKYYDAITPFGSGGQPFQIYALTKAGITPGHASCVVLVKYLAYQFAFTLYGLIAFFSTSAKMLSINPLYYYLAILGVIINIALPLFVLLLTYKRTRFEKVFLFFVKIGEKLHLVKDHNKAVAQIDRVVTPFVNALTELRQHKKKAIIIFLLSAVEILFFISLPYVVYLSSLPSITSAGLAQTSWFDITLLYLFVYFVVSIFPIPGGTGAAEFGFTWVFASFFTAATLPLSVLIWRSISFYLPLLIGFSIILYDSFKPLFIKMKNPKDKTLSGKIAPPKLTLDDEGEPEE